MAVSRKLNWNNILVHGETSSKMLRPFVQSASRELGPVREHRWQGLDDVEYVLDYLDASADLKGL